MPRSRVVLRYVGDIRWMRVVIAKVETRPVSVFLEPSENAELWTGFGWSRSVRDAVIYLSAADARIDVQIVRRFPELQNL